MGTGLTPTVTDPAEHLGGGSRLLVIARELGVGGAAFLALRHLQRLQRPVDLLVTGPVAPEMAAALPEGVRLERLEPDLPGRAAPLLVVRVALAGLGHPFLTRRYDTVLATSLFPDPVACVAFSLSRASRKLLMLVDEGLLAATACRETVAAMRGALLAADHLLPVSQALLDGLCRHQPLLAEIPATVIPPPIEPPQPNGPAAPWAERREDGPLRVVTLARLTRDKQIDRCLQVHRELRDQGLDFHWHVIGEGEERPQLERQLHRLRMQDRFHLEGFLDNPRAWIRAADLFVLASCSEGCPTVIREAIAEGTPVLSTEVNGVRELLDDGITGVITEDSGERFSAALSRLIRDRDLRQRLRRSIRARSRSGDPQDETAALEPLLAGGPRRRRPARVSILIPTYNQASRIVTAIQSALMQDFADLEVIVCDDASTDATAEVAMRFSHDPRLRVRRNRSNLGRVGNYRKALQQDARGDWVLMLDGDDYLADPGFIDKAMQALSAQEQPLPLFLQAGHRVVWPSRSDATAPGPRRRDILPEISSDRQRMDGADYLRFMLETGFFSHLGSLYQRRAALENDFYSKDISSSDMDSLLRLALCGDVLIMNSVAGCWVQHGDNSSANVPLARVGENVRIFRDIASQAAAAGRLSLKRLNPSLRRHEARTLTTLMSATIGRTALHPGHAFQMLAISLRLHPRTLLTPPLPGALLQAFVQLTRLSLRQRLPQNRRNRHHPA